MTFSTKNSLRSTLLALCLGGAACGGSSPTPNTPEPQPSSEPAVASPSTPMIADSPPQMQLPTIPGAAVSAPAGLMMEFALSSPKNQLTNLGVFLDVVQPGAGAFMSAQLILQQLETQVGAVGIAGLDLNAPLFALMLDTQNVVLVAKISDEAGLRQSLDGVKTGFIIHDGFVAVGAEAALSEVAPYALSNLITQDSLPFPTISMHLGKIMKGKMGDQLKSELRQNVGAFATSVLVEGMQDISMLRISVETDQSAAKVHVIADVEEGNLRSLLGKQKPAAYSKLAQVGTGPWGILAGGRLDLTMLSPIFAQLGKQSGDEFIRQIMAQLGELVGEIGVAVNFPAKPKVVFAMDLTNAGATDGLVGLLMDVAAKTKNLTLMDMKAKVKVSAIKTKSGRLHEVKLTPSNEKQISLFGKKPVSAFWGVMSDSLVGTFGVDAKKNARTLSKPTGKIRGSGSKIAAAIEMSKSKNESAVIALDVVSLQERRAVKDVTPVILGVGFTSDQIRGRVVVPTEFVKEMMSGF